MLNKLYILFYELIVLHSVIKCLFFKKKPISITSYTVLCTDCFAIGYKMLVFTHNIKKLVFNYLTKIKINISGYKSKKTCICNKKNTLTNY